MTSVPDPRRVYKLAIGGESKPQRYVVETRVAGGGRLGVILTGLRSPDRVLVSAANARARLSAEEFVCGDEDVERALVAVGAIRIVRVEGSERVCVLASGEVDARGGEAEGRTGGTAAAAAAAAVGPSPSKADVLGMLSGIMRGASPRVVRRDEEGGAASDGAARGAEARGTAAGAPRAKQTTTMLTPRTARGGIPSRGTPGSVGSAPSPSASLPLGTFGETRQTFFAADAFASAADPSSRAAGGDDYLESMMSDFSATLLGDLSGGGRGGAFEAVPSLGAPRAPSGGFPPAVREGDARAMRDRHLPPFFASSTVPASGILDGALEEGVDVAPMEDVSGLYGGDASRVDDEFSRHRAANSDALGFDATPAELVDLLNRSRVIRNVAETLGDLGIDDMDAPTYESSSPVGEKTSAEICTAFNLRGDKFGCDGCVNRHVCQLCESPRHAFGMCPSLYARIHKRAQVDVCLDYYLNSVDETGGALRNGWDQDKHSWTLCPRGAACELEHVCGSCGKSGTNKHLPSCRLHAIFDSPPPVDLCRKYFLHSLGDYFKTEGDSHKFKVGSSGGWALCNKGDRCHSRHICGHCGAEGRGKHKPECKLFSVCGVVDADKAPCFLYFMKSMAGVREFEKGLLGGAAKAFCSQKKGECTGYHVCGSCGEENVSPHTVDGHAPSCRMRTISNEVDPTLNPRTKQMLKDYEEELARVRASSKSRETASTQTSTVSSKSETLDDHELTQIDVKRCRFLRSEIEAVLRGLEDEIDLLCEEAVEKAGTEVKRMKNPQNNLEKIREGLRQLSDWRSGENSSRK